MDASSLSTGNVDLSRLSDTDKQELQRFVVNESQKARIQECVSFPPNTLSLSSSSANLSFSHEKAKKRKKFANYLPTAIHSLTDICFRKCVTSKISSGKLDKYEEPCMQNCVDRFLDANHVILRQLETLRNSS